jgi:predicted component of type VI protein secretion system
MGGTLVRIGMTRLVVFLLFFSSPALSAGQDPLAAVAKAAREAVLRGDFGSLVPSQAGVQLRLPGVEPSGSLGRAQYNATMRDVFRRTETSDVTIEDFREVGGGRAFVELKREYRVQGSSGRKSQRILLSYRKNGADWELVEVRAN